MASIAPPAVPDSDGEMILAPTAAPLSDKKDLPAEEHSGQLRVAMIGNVDSGKSTLTGCLTRNVVDDGRGAARVHVRRFPSVSAFCRSAQRLCSLRYSAIAMKLRTAELRLLV
jgi:GTPase SAR1 family protein